MDDMEKVLSDAPVTLDQLSVDELRHRIATLQNEIAACERELAKKQAHKSAADALFGGDG